MLKYHIAVMQMKATFMMCAALYMEESYQTDNICLARYILAHYLLSGSEFLTIELISALRSAAHDFPTVADLSSKASFLWRWHTDN